MVREKRNRRARFKSLSTLPVRLVRRPEDEPRLISVRHDPPVEVIVSWALDDK